MFKKTIIMLMVGVITISVMACGGGTSNETSNENSSGVTEAVGEYKNAATPSKTLSIFDDGTAVFSAKPDQTYTWTESEDTLVLSYHEDKTWSNGLTETINDEIVYKKTEINGINALKADTGGVVFLPESTSDDICATITDEVRQDLVRSTQVLDLDKMWSTLSSNVAKGKMEYDNKDYILTVGVMNIGTNNFEYMRSYEGDGTKSITVYMETEELAQLNNGEPITIFGTINVGNESNIFVRNVFVVDDYMDLENQSGDIDKEFLINEFDGDPDNDGKISWTAGSLDYFTKNYGTLPKLGRDDFLEQIVGKQWNAKYYVEPNREITILLNADGTAIETEDGKEHNWDWTFEDVLHLPASRQSNYEVRKVDDDMYIIYEIGSSVGYPHWLLWVD